MAGRMPGFFGVDERLRHNRASAAIKMKRTLKSQFLISHVNP
jgi:hypothetical protein